MYRLTTAVLQSGESGGSLESLLFFVALFGLGLYLIYRGFNDWQLKQLVKDTPTEKIRSVAVGRTELEGISRKHEHTIDPPLVDEECVYVKWKVERREKHRDSDGDVQYTWEQKGSGKRAVPFVLEDDTGRIIVRADLDDPKFDIRKDKHTITRTYDTGERADDEVRQYIQRYREWEHSQPKDDEGFLQGVTGAVKGFLDEENPLGNASRRRRYTQTVFPVGIETYVFGEARSRRGAHVETGQEDLLEMRRDEDTDVFLIADGTEDKVTDRYSSGWLKIAGGLLLSAIALWAILSGFWMTV